MAAEKGIFLDVLPRFDMAAMGAILNAVEGLFKKSGAAIGTTFGAEAQANIAKLAEAERASANVTEDAELRKTRAIHATEIADQQASLATERRILAESRLGELQKGSVASETSIAEAKVRVQAAENAVSVAMERRTNAAARLDSLTRSGAATEIQLASAKLQVSTAEQNAAVATERRVLAEGRLQEVLAPIVATEDSVTAARLRVEAATIAETRASYAASDAALLQTSRARDLASAQALSMAAADKHSAAVAASTATVSNAGRALNLAGMAATGTFVVGLAEATKAASNFEVSQTRIQVATAETATNIKTLHDGVLTLGPQIGQTAQDLENASFILAKGGFKDANDQLAILKAGGQLARVELAPLDETMKGLTTTLTDFGLSGKDAPQVVSQLQVALGNAKVPMDEFMGSLHNVEPVFKMLTGGDPTKAAAGIAQVTTALARMTQNGTSADQASQNIRNSILQLAKLDTNQNAISTLSEAGMKDASKIPQMLTDPAIGYLGVLDKIHETINSKLGPDGKLVESALYSNPQAAQDMITQYNALDDAHRKMADDIQNGTIPSLKDLHLTEAEGQQGDLLKEWDKARQTVEGFNPILAKHGDLVRNALQLWQQATGSTQGLLVASQLYGSDEAAASTNKLQQQTQGAKPDASGNIEGWGQVTDTLKFKLDSAKASVEALAIQVGEVFLPAMKGVADVLADVFGWMNRNHDVAVILMATIGGFATLWAGFTGWKIAAGMVETVSTGMTALIGRFGLLKTAIAGSSTELTALGATATAVEGEVVGAATAEATAEGSVGAAATASAGEITAVGGAATASATVVEGAAAAEAVAIGTVADAAAIAGGAIAALAVAVGGFIYWGNQKLKDLPTNAENARGHGADAIARSGGNSPIQGMTRNPVVDHQGHIPGSAGEDTTGINAGVDRRGRTMGSAGEIPHPELMPGYVDTPVMPDYSGALPGSTTSGSGGAPGGAGGASGTTPAAPVGTENDPIYIDPRSITDGLNSSDMGADGQVGGGMLNIFTNAGSGGFTLPNIARLMGTFVANLALGNPAGKLATGQFGSDSGGDITQSITDIENMTPAQRIEEQNTIKMRKAISAYKQALRSYATAVQKYGAGSDQALNAEDSVLSAKDGIASAELGMQQKGGSAAQTFADDQANGTATKNPGKYAKDKAAAEAYGGVASATDASLLSNVPSGQYVNPGGTYDLSKGLADCSSAVGDLVKTMDGQATGGPDRLNTGNASTWLPQHGFLPNTTGANVPGAFNVGYDAAHMQATLPGGTNFNWGSAAAAADRGLNGGGAFDPTGGGTGPFTSHYYRPVDSGGSSGGSSDIWAPSNTSPGLNNPGVGGGDPLPSIIPGSAGQGFLGLRQGPQIGGPGPGTRGGGGGGGGAPGSNLVSAGINAATNGHPAGGPAVGAPASPGVQSTQAPSGSGKGAGASGGGLLGGAMGAASMAANAFAPGAGAAVQIGMEEAERAAGYAGQVAGIAAQGLLETFTLHGSDGGGGGKGGWLGKIAGGLAGAHPSIPNGAGALNPPAAKDNTKDASTPAPGLNPADSANGQAKGGDPNAKGGNNINIENQNINHGDGGAQNRDAMRQLMAYPQ